MLTIDDFFVFTIGEPISDLDAAPYGGGDSQSMFELICRVFVGFHLDIGIGDAVMEPIEVIEGRDWLGFAGIVSPRCTLFLASNNLPKNFTRTLCHERVHQIAG